MAAFNTATKATANGVTYRPLEWSDLDAIVEEFDCTWGETGSLSRDLSQRLSRHFTLHYLEPATRAEVAVDEESGSFMGVTLSRVVGQPVLFDQVPQALAEVDGQLGSTAAGTRALSLTNGWHDLERRMESVLGINAHTQAELELFLVARAARGRGVGGTLWRRLLASFASQGVERYYLHTDSGCDVSFYDHQGLNRVAERYAKDHPDEPVPDDADLFIYAGEVTR
ncbi:GNAT family N-acetyltransferase [Bifidobacterium panos]|uniref:GNAT family N-acetyltransferase n=1 Tax=Bifidobacterium panos TaxID=2675321 RepID=A0ABX1SUW8_9BIFI|nr:GNAT family N-acetyltransferase [Bifidobacterium sp. DSM 109963]NMN01623.1 GNAT family N-acetyltransferase [Bifidobacterium sp. DSM 109963]